MKPEEQIATLRRIIFWLLLFSILLMIALSVSILALGHVLHGNELPFDLTLQVTGLPTLSDMNCFT